jgi:hypothetical protein
VAWDYVRAEIESAIGLEEAGQRMMQPLRKVSRINEKIEDLLGKVTGAGTSEGPHQSEGNFFLPKVNHAI